MDTERRLVTLPGGRDLDLLLAGPAQSTAEPESTTQMWQELRKGR